MKTIIKLLEDIDFEYIALYTIMFVVCATVCIFAVYLFNAVRYLKLQRKELAKEQAKEQLKSSEIGHTTSCENKFPDENDPPFVWEMLDLVVNNVQETEREQQTCHLIRMPTYVGEIVTFEKYKDVFLRPSRFTDKATFSIERNTLAKLRAITEDTGCEVSLSAFIDNILRHHLAEHKTLINNATSKTLRKQTISDL
ncbi:DUF3408 domain-containing protein [Petrimonas sp.]|uniref:DUF3408 domain-containing protein n=1 Tax=Petrimonas sp. TaxID=2023866 RepID=UPI003F51837A